MDDQDQAIREMARGPERRRTIVVTDDDGVAVTAVKLITALHRFAAECGGEYPDCVFMRERDARSLADGLVRVAKAFDALVTADKIYADILAGKFKIMGIPIEVPPLSVVPGCPFTSGSAICDAVEADQPGEAAAPGGAVGADVSVAKPALPARALRFGVP